MDVLIPPYEVIFFLLSNRVCNFQELLILLINFRSVFLEQVHFSYLQPLILQTWRWDKKK